MSRRAARSRSAPPPRSPAAKSAAKPRRSASRPLFARIGSGEFKNQKILLPPLAPDKASSPTRPSKAALRAALFNILRPVLAGRTFIEGFAGSAGMAIEALSNGAARAIAIERDLAAIKIIRANQKNFPQLELREGDLFALLPGLLNELGGAESGEGESGAGSGAVGPVVLYFDPPFECREGFGDIYERIIRLLGELDLAGISHIIFEHHSRASLPESLLESLAESLAGGAFARVGLKRFGSSSLSLYEAWN